MGKGTTLTPQRCLRIVSDTSFRTDFTVKLNYCLALVDCSAMSIIARQAEHSSFPLCMCLQRHVKRKTGDAWKWEILQAALLSSWIWIHWGQEVLIPEVHFWDENSHMSPASRGIVPATLVPRSGEWDMETPFWGRHSIHLLNRSIIQQLTSLLPQRAKFTILPNIIKAHPALATLYMCPCGQKHQPWVHQHWRVVEPTTEEPGMLSSVPPAAGSSSGESRHVLAEREDELQSCCLQKASVIGVPHAE